MKVSERMRRSWSSFRAGQSAHKAGVRRIDNPYTLEGEWFNDTYKTQLMNSMSEHDRKVREKAWFDGWDKPNK